MKTKIILEALITKRESMIARNEHSKCLMEYPFYVESEFIALSNQILDLLKDYKKICDQTVDYKTVIEDV